MNDVRRLAVRATETGRPSARFGKRVQPDTAAWLHQGDMRAHGAACEKHRPAPPRRRRRRNARGCRQPTPVQCPERIACRHGRYGASPRGLARVAAQQQAARLSGRKEGDAGACQLKEVVMLKKVMEGSCRARTSKVFRRASPSENEPIGSSVYLCSACFRQSGGNGDHGKTMDLIELCMPCRINRRSDRYGQRCPAMKPGHACGYAMHDANVLTQLCFYCNQVAYFFIKKRAVSIRALLLVDLSFNLDARLQ